jgi:hypothetical protein
MTPKEKARELVEIYVDVNEFYNNQYNNKVVVRNYNFAKQCALIAVDEIKTSLGILNVDILHTGVDFSHLITEVRTNYNSHIIYWNEVKQEIEKL